ncbi:unnamed protein product [Haemonchus placei]|uniref:Uncharacterized protein n=1 Tax=Haemonchus placei TaxID=6290 RepID=A0A3P7ZY18_HAEPC|nr:unnamed protein product [Haemonchus placei]
MSENGAGRVDVDRYSQRLQYRKHIRINMSFNVFLSVGLFPDHSLQLFHCCNLFVAFDPISHIMSYIVYAVVFLISYQPHIRVNLGFFFG